MRKVYPLDEVLSVSTGYLVAERHVDALYDLMGHLTGDEGISTIGLAGAAKSCEAELKKQFPELERVTKPRWADTGVSPSKQDVQNWIVEQRELLGANSFDVEGDTARNRDYSFLDRTGTRR